MSAIQSIKRAVWPEKGMRRKLRYWRGMLFERVTRRRILRELRELGLREGMTVTVHSTMSALGYVDGGGRAFIEALIEAVGGPEKGTVMMPTFSMEGSTRSFLNEFRGKIDLRELPSATGRMTELFRTHPGVRRSAHPTHSVGVIGPRADELIADHYKASTPFGPQTPWARWPELPDSYILLVHNNFGTLMHVAQEQVDFPNLYEEGPLEEIPFIDAEGAERITRTRVMISSLVNYILLPRDAGPAPPGMTPFVGLWHYPIAFPRARREAAKGHAYYDFNIGEWERKERELIDGGILRQGLVGPATVGLVKAKACLEYMKNDLRRLVPARREDYREDVLRPLMATIRDIPKR
jgi:aminoglycoside 3-N-acetyltransferase